MNIDDADRTGHAGGGADDGAPAANDNFFHFGDERSDDGGDIPPLMPPEVGGGFGGQPVNDDEPVASVTFTDAASIEAQASAQAGAHHRAASSDDGPDDWADRSTDETGYAPAVVSGTGLSGGSEGSDAGSGAVDLDLAVMAPPRRGAGFVGLLTLVTLLGGAGFVLWQAPQLANAGILPDAGPTDSSAAGVWFTSIDEGRARAEEEDKPLLILFTADWCPPCQHMKSAIFPDRAVRNLLHDDFVTVKVDLTERSGPSSMVAQQYGVTGIPAVYVYHPSGYEINRRGAAMQSGEFAAWLRACRDEVR